MEESCSQAYSVGVVQTPSVNMRFLALNLKPEAKYPEMLKPDAQALNP